MPNIPLKQFKNNLFKIIELIRRYNLDCNILFLTIPYSPDKQIDLFRQKYNLVINEVSKKSNCYVIDTYDLTKNKNMLNKTEHFSDEAHKKIAQLIKNHIDST